MRNIRKILTLLCISALAIVLAGPLYGQNEDMFIPSEQKQLTAVTEPATLMQGFLRVGFDWQYTGFRRIFDENGDRVFVPGSSVARSSSAEMVLQYGVTDRIQVNLVIPYMMDKLQSTILLDDPLFRARDQVDYQENGFGFGDISSGVYVQLFEETENRPSLTMRTTATVPTGRKNASGFSADSLSYDSPTGSGETSVAVDLQLRKIIYPYSFSFYAGSEIGFGGEKVLIPGEPESSFRSGNLYYAAGGFNFHLNDWICMTNDLYYTYIGPESVAGIRGEQTKWQLNLVPYLHFQVQQLRLVQGMFIPLKGKLISGDPSYIFIVQYVF